MGLGWEQEKAWIMPPRWAYKCGSVHWISNWDYYAEDLDDVPETIYISFEMVCGDSISLGSAKEASRIKARPESCQSLFIQVRPRNWILLALEDRGDDSLLHLNNQ